MSSNAYLTSVFPAKGFIILCALILSTCQIQASLLQWNNQRIRLTEYTVLEYIVLDSAVYCIILTARRLETVTPLSVNVPMEKRTFYSI